jgi:signal transduction histidine kinase
MLSPHDSSLCGASTRPTTSCASVERDVHQVSNTPARSKRVVFAGLPRWPSWFGERAARPEQVPGTPSPGLQQYELVFWWRFLQPLCLGLVMAGAGYLVAGVGGLICRPFSLWNGLGAVTVGGLGYGLLRHGQGPLGVSVVVGGLSGLVVVHGWQHGITSLVSVLGFLGIVLSGFLLDGWLLTRPIASALHIIRRQAAVLTRMAHALTTEPVLDTFLGQVLTAIAEQLHADRAALWFHDRTQDTLAIYMTTEKGHVLVTSQMGSAAPQPRPANEMPVWQELKHSRHPIFIADVTHDARLVLRDALAAQGVKTLLLVPLLLDDEVTGWMSIRSTTPRRYQPEEFALAQALSQHVMLAVQLSCFAEQRRQAAVLEERTRLAREIHDTLAQGLTGIVVQLEAAEDALAETPAEAQAHMARARQLARASLAEARRSVRALRPQALTDSDLPTALPRLAEQVTAQTPLQAQVQVHGTPCPLPPEVENALLRIGQEALINTVKHAQASTVQLALTFDAAAVCLRVTDDGRGFDPQRAATHEEFGLVSMQERAERIGGRFTLTSWPTHGTTVMVVVPMAHQAQRSSV